MNSASRYSPAALLLPAASLTIKRLIRFGVTPAVTTVVLACTTDTMTAPGIPELSIYVGDNQTAVVGSVLPSPIVVQVTGVSPANGQILNFVVTSGGGSVF